MHGARRQRVPLQIYTEEITLEAHPAGRALVGVKS